MQLETWVSFASVWYVLAFGAFLAGGIAFCRARRKTKWPFKASDRLLRGPGEGLRREVVRIDEAFLQEYVGSVLVAVVCYPVFVYLGRALGLTGWKAVAFVLGGLLTVAAIFAWRAVRVWKKRSNHYLGWFGERLVAEKLRPLQSQGYRVFHDVPGEPGKKGFNIDHVVVGPAGVAVVEVKTRRKGNARPGLKDHEVIFDGTKVIWPQGDDRRSIQQAINEADWLTKWIFARTGLRVAVKPCLTFPGWFVRESPNAALRVVNPDFLPKAIIGSGDIVLQPGEVDLIARQLDTICRDVED
jgi:hypothetical protein